MIRNLEMRHWVIVIKKQTFYEGELNKVMMVIILY